MALTELVNALRQQAIKQREREGELLNKRNSRIRRGSAAGVIRHIQRNRIINRKRS